MGVRRLFSRGGQKSSRGGQEPTFCLRNNKKDTIFLKKSLKTYCFWPALAGQGGGKSPSLPPPPDAHVRSSQKAFAGHIKVLGGLHVAREPGVVRALI